MSDVLDKTTRETLDPKLKDLIEPGDRPRKG